MSIDNVLHALVSIQNWGDKQKLEHFLKNNVHVISLYHTMGKQSYIIDANFDNKKQLEIWISELKSLTLPGGVPSILNIQTQKIIDVDKQKNEYSLKDYLDQKSAHHFFMYVDTKGKCDDLLEYVKNVDEIFSMLHIQGQHSYVMEILADNYNQYKNILIAVKSLDSVLHVETCEVITVIKYRNHVLGETGQLVYPKEDIRELYTL